MRKIFGLFLLLFSAVFVFAVEPPTKYPSQYIDNWGFDEDIKAHRVIITTGTISIGTVDIAFPDVQKVADERYQGKVSSGTAGKITGVTSSSVNISDNVVKFTFKYRNDADDSQYAVISNNKMGGASYLADGDVISVEMVVPSPINFTISSLSPSATLQYVITTIK